MGIKYIEGLAEQLVSINCQPISRWNLNLHVLFLRLECFSLLHWNAMGHAIEWVILFEITLQLLLKLKFSLLPISVRQFCQLFLQRPKT
jgi:hypothetical protein